MPPLETQKKLRMMGQEQLLAHWERLNGVERAHLLGQIDALDPVLLRRLQALIQASLSIPTSPFEPLGAVASRGNKGDQERGLERLKRGKVGALIVAGGQGTRLGSDGPKGSYPLSLIKQKSLFQLFAEKTIAAGKQAGHPLPFALMTSPQNHHATQEFFRRHHLFGLNPDQLSFFVQTLLPFMDREGRLFLEKPDTLALGPDGNGGALQRFIASGVWDRWRERGVETLSFGLIDNPLGDPFDAELIGFHARRDNEVTVKAIARRDPEEKVGVLVVRDKRLAVVEYSEMPEQERAARLSDGSLAYASANISLFCFSMDFIERIQDRELPLHPTLKPTRAYEKDPPHEAWKFEKFIFDVLPFAQRAEALLYPREECFAPLKSRIQAAEVAQALQRRDRAIYEALSGLPAPDRPFELAQEFHYPTPKLRSAWRNRPLPPDEYITS